MPSLTLNNTLAQSDAERVLTLLSLGQADEALPLACEVETNCPHETRIAPGHIALWNQVNRTDHSPSPETASEIELALLSIPASASADSVAGGLMEWAIRIASSPQLSTRSITGLLHAATDSLTDLLPETMVWLEPQHSPSSRLQAASGPRLVLAEITSVANSHPDLAVRTAASCLLMSVRNASRRIKPARPSDLENQPVFHLPALSETVCPPAVEYVTMTPPAVTLDIKLLPGTKPAEDTDATDVPAETSPASSMSGDDTPAASLPSTSPATSPSVPPPVTEASMPDDASLLRPSEQIQRASGPALAGIHMDMSPQRRDIHANHVANAFGKEIEPGNGPVQPVRREPATSPLRSLMNAQTAIVVALFVMCVAIVAGLGNGLKANNEVRNATQTSRDGETSVEDSSGDLGVAQ